MSDSIVIDVNQIAKRYRIGVAQQKADTVLTQLIDLAKSPVRNFKRLSSLSKFSDDEDESIFWALRNINFQVKEGEVLGIIGHNGAGKSTLLKILSRITEPSNGTIKINGRISALLEVGTGFHPELTGRDNIYMNGTILGMRKKEIDKKLDEIIDFSGIEKHIDTPVKFYSSGMKVRLGFSVAAHLEPEILIIDEVLAVGDMEFQKKCLGKMENVAGNGRTVLFVSHNMEAVDALCGRCVLLKNGNIIYDGNTREGISQYLQAGSSEQLYILEKQFKSDKSFYISKASIKDCNGDVLKNPFTTEKEAYLELEVESNRDITQAHISYELFNEMNVRILRSDVTDFDRKIGSFKKGTNYIRVKLCSHLLSSGSYYINFHLGDLISFENDHKQNLLAFQVFTPSFMKPQNRGLIQEVYKWQINS